MTILTTTEKFEFLSIESCPRSTKSCSRPSKSPAISGKPGALKGTNLRTVAPIANAHIFYASRVHPARSRDFCMSSDAKIKF